MEIGSDKQDSIEQLSKDMVNLSLINVEIKKLKASLKRVEENKIKGYNAYISKVQRNFKFIKQLEKHVDESVNA